jgi:hypothetical protein
MSLALLMAIQAAAPAEPQAMLSIDFNLAEARPATGLSLEIRRGCARPSGDEIVVCGRRESGEDYPMGEMARLFATRPIRAEMGLGGGMTARSYLEQVGLDRGAVSNRIMVGVRLPF